MPFRLAADKMSRNFNVSISHDTICRATETIGSQEFNKQKQALTGEEVLECEYLSVPEQIYLQIDGSMVNTTTDGWKEYKLALFYDKNDIVKSNHYNLIKFFKH